MTHPRPDVTDAVHGVFCDIPGVQVVDVTTDPDAATVTIVLDGWGPTLHHRRLTLGLDIGEPGRIAVTEEGVTMLVTLSLAHHAGAQRMLARTGEAYGLYAPMARPGHAGDPDTSGPSIGHIRIGIATIEALLANFEPEAAAAHLINAVADAIGGDIDEMGEDVHAGSDPQPDMITQHAVTVHEDNCTLHHRDGMPAMALSWSLTENDRTVATVVEEDVRFEPESLASLPESVCTALVGQPLGKLFTTGSPRLDALPIATAITGEDGVDVRLDAPDIRIADHPLIGRFTTVPGVPAP